MRQNFFDAYSTEDEISDDFFDFLDKAALVAFIRVFNRRFSQTKSVE